MIRTFIVSVEDSDWPRLTLSVSGDVNGDSRSAYYDIADTAFEPSVCFALRQIVRVIKSNGGRHDAVDSQRREEIHEQSHNEVTEVPVVQSRKRRTKPRLE